jgi:tetrahydromethanopterin S-methyltransferase subunit H
MSLNPRYLESLGMNEEQISHYYDFIEKVKLASKQK